RDRFESAREMAIALEGCGKLATMSEVSAWVEALAHDTLAARAVKVAEFESYSLPAAAQRAYPPAMPLPSTSPSQGVTSLAPIVKHTTFTPVNARDRKSTRLNSSHLVISYAVFC